MMLIILHHFSIHGVWPGDGPLSTNIAIALISFGGKLGVNCFVLITGYFMVRKRFKVESLVRLLFQTWFYSYLILIIFLLFDPSLVNVKVLKKALFPVCTGEYWFVTCYAALFVLSPIMNRLYHSLSPKYLSRAMALGMVLFSLIPTVTASDALESNLLWFGYLYLLGGWIRDQIDNLEQSCLADPIALTRKAGPSVTLGASLLFIWGTIAVLHWAKGALGFNLIGPRYFTMQYSLPILFASVSLFCIFEKSSLRDSKWINALAAAALGVYLIHDNPLIRSWLWPHFSQLYDTGFLFVIVYAVIIAIFVYLICAIADIARARLFEKPLMHFLQNRLATQFDRINDWINPA